MIISISGPSKSGKTVLVKKILGPNIIPLSGATIRSGDHLWNKVLDWMDVPNQHAERTETTVSAEATASAGGKIGVPFVAQGKAEAGGTIGADRSTAREKTFQRGGLAQVIREIADSEFAVFVDDFHYIPKDTQIEIGQQIKEAAEAGVRVLTASVPHRSDDVVRSNTELRGRVVAIDTLYWNDDELEQIAYKGFRELNMDVAPAIVRTLTRESFGSPQLMQAIGLNFCFESDVKETLPDQRRIEMNFATQERVLERTSTQTDFSSMTSVLHSGPRQRGTERKEFRFTDGSTGDVYRCVLLAMRGDPPQLSFRYSDMIARTKAVCVNDCPVGSSVAQALAQMNQLARTVQEAPVIEWDEDVLDIVEPYFLFFLRSSSFLRRLA